MSRKQGSVLGPMRKHIIGRSVWTGQRTKFWLMYALSQLFAWGIKHKLVNGSRTPPLLPPSIARALRVALHRVPGSAARAVASRVEATMASVAIMMLQTCRFSQLSGWPSGLRRQTQGHPYPLSGSSVLVLVWGRGFESHFWHDFFSSFFSFLCRK